MSVSTDNSTVVYCGQGLDDFHTRYHSIHGYLSLTVCILGCIMNVVNVVVLTRREIRSPTNAILTGLAVADFLVMIDYIPYSWFDYILPNMNYTRKTLFSYSTAWFIMFHSIFAQICHTISIWLTVTLAVWRYIAVAYPHRNRIWCNMRTTLITIASAYIVCPFAAIPLYLVTAIQSSIEILDNNGQIYKGNSSSSNISNASISLLPVGFKNVTVYKVQFSDIARNNPSLITFNLWMYSILIKLIPCFALTILSLRLIGALLEAKRRRKQLMNSNGMQMLSNGKAIDGGGAGSGQQTNRRNTKSLEKEKQTDRTTRMLLAVLLLFLITEFPQGILGLLSVILGPAFYLQCYLKLVTHHNSICICIHVFIFIIKRRLDK
ncbi:sex peptide receptor-like [Contarinia nasturtii]|uniref:sex peptide receptor-like n=1 Tax=Contarinia nasturtii TaxID=265458 RepID=UPI0012D4A7CE|nr:sex peptide receptor-like [Contarinia nasturtii]